VATVVIGRAGVNDLDTETTENKPKQTETTTAQLDWATAIQVALLSVWFSFCPFVSVSKMLWLPERPFSQRAPTVSAV